MSTFRKLRKILLLGLIFTANVQALEIENKEISAYFRGLDPNAGGLAVIGLRARYRFVELGLNVSPNIIPSVALRIQFLEGNWFSPHLAIGYPYFGTGMEFLFPKLWVIRPLLRVDQYLSLFLLTGSLRPWFTLGLGVNF